MKSFFRNALLVLLATFGLMSEAMATHAMGGDLTYECLGNNQYRIRLKFFRDCSGIPAPTQPVLSLSSATCGGAPLSVTMTQTAVTQLNTACPGQTTTCTGGAAFGVQRYDYEATVTLTNSCPDWRVSWDYCCRNTAITTIFSPDQQDIYLETFINNTQGLCNNSPTFSNNPVAFICLGQNFTFNHGVVDTDGDSLSFSLITPRSGTNLPVQFVPGRNALQPMGSTGPFTLNNISGTINFTPNTIEVGVMTVLVREFRNGVQIGSVMRDLQFIITNCANAIPSASGINGTNDFFVTVCPDQPICFDILSSDANANQVVTMTWNNGIPGATFTVSGGPRPTGSFCWTPTFADVNLNANTFTVTVADNACPNVASQTFSYSILVPSPFVEISTTDAVCGQGGTATATPQIANTNYSYAWSNGASTATISGLATGTYTLTVTDPTGCAVTTTAVVGGVNQTIALNGIVTNATCGGNNGSVNLLGGGVNAPNANTYVWSNGASGQVLFGVPAGTYTVTGTTPNGCSASATFTVGGTSGPSVSLEAIPFGCNGTGYVDATVTGGTAPFTYSWSNGATTQDIGGVPNGTYTFIVFDANQCVASATATLTTFLPLTAVATGTDVSCSGPGQVAVDVTAGDGPFTYLWSTGDPAQYVNNLQAGTYTVTVTSVNGCTAVASATVGTVTCCNVTDAGEIGASQSNCGPFTAATLVSIEDPSGGLGALEIQWVMSVGCTGTWVPIPGANALTYDPGLVTETTCFRRCARRAGCPDFVGESNIITITVFPGITVTATATDVTCDAAGTATAVNAANGANFTYLWSNGETTGTITGLVAGVYTVTVSEGNGCSGTATVTVGEVTCCNVTDAGEIGANQSNCGPFDPATLVSIEDPSGGTGALEIQWIMSVGCTGTWVPIPGANGLTYDPGLVTETTCFRRCARRAGCQAFVGESNIITITVLPGITVTATGTDVTCDAAGTATAVNAANGANFTYLWSNGETTGTITGLVAGVYTVTVTDGNGCSGTATVTVGEVICCNVTDAGEIGANQSNCGPFDPAPLVSIEDPSGGTGALEIQWIMSVGCTGTWVPIPGANGLTYDPGLVTETTCFRRCARRAGCQAFVGESNIITITVFPTITVTATATGNTATATPTGGTAPFAYNWSNGGTTATIANLPGGTYTVTVTDANGCTGTASVQIAVPCQIFTNLIATAPNCNGGCTGTATAAAINGNAPYTFVWGNGQTGATATGLCPGMYHVTVTDAAGCTATACVTVPVGEPLMTGTIVTNATCNGTCDGAVNLFVSGGTESYTFQWSNGTTNEDLANACPGSYDVTVTDATGCTAHACVVVLGSPMTVSATATNVTCFGACNGSVTATATGQAPYTYLWNSGATTATVANRCPGTYRVTVTAANGCTGTAQATVTQPAAGLQVTGQIVHPTGNNCNGGINITVSGGTAPYTFQWNNGATTEDRTNLCSGQYYVIVRDANGCSRSMSFKLIRQIVIENCPDGPVRSRTCPNLCDLQVSPVPTNGPISVVFDLASADDVRVELTDAEGRIIKFQSYEQTARVSDLRFDLSGQAPGAYYVRIVTSLGAHAEKVVYQP